MRTQWIYSQIKKINDGTLDKLQSYSKTLEQKVEERTSETGKSQLNAEAILSGIGDTIIVLDTNLNIIWANKVAIGQYGDILGRKCYGVFEWLDEPCSDCVAKDAFMDGKVKSLVKDIVLKNGTQLNFIVTCSPIRGPNRENDSIVLVMHDITERNKAEKELKESEENYRNLVGRANDGIVIIQDGVLKYVNSRTAEIMGYSPEELVNTQFNDYIHPAELPRVVDLYKRRMAGEGVVPVYETLIKSKDGSYVDVELNAGIFTYDGKNADFVLIRDITEHKRAEKELLNAHQKLLDIIEFLPYATFVIDAEKKVIAWNLAIEEMTGIQKEDILGKGDYAYSVPLYGKRKPILIDLVFDYVNVTEEEYEHSDMNKKYLSAEVFAPSVYGGKGAYISVRASPLFDASGKEIGAIESIRDITERKKVEETLKASEKKYSTLVEKGNDGIIFIQDGLLKFANEKMAKMTGFTLEEGIGRPFLEFISPEFRETAQERYQQSLNSDGDTSSSYVLDLLSKEGTKIPAEVSPSLIEYEGKPAFMAIIRDITEHRKNEKILQEQREFAASLVLYSTVPTFVIDSQHKILHWNKASEELTGIKASEIVGTDKFYSSKNPSFADIVISRELGEHLDRSKKYGRSKYVSNGLHAENWVSNLGGMRRYVLFDAAPIYNSKGELVCALETMQEITEQKQTEEAIHEYAEKLKYSNELKDLFTDILHHDLLNPAGVVGGHTEILLDMEDNEQKRHSLYAIERNTEKLVNIIQRASKFAKLESVEKLELEAMDIGDILKEVIESFQPRLKEKQMTVEFEANGGYPASVNPVIEEVFSNLLANAIKYSPEKTRIIIDIMDAGEDWKVSITDFGEGIADEDKVMFFERFKRADRRDVKGTGLGLAIVKRLITMHGGTVGVEDNPAGQGSRFWVTVGKA